MGEKDSGRKRGELASAQAGFLNPLSTHHPTPCPLSISDSEALPGPGASDPA